MDPQVLELVKATLGFGLSGGGVLGFYLLYRKFEAERAASLREDNKPCGKKTRSCVKSCAAQQKTTTSYETNSGVGHEPC